MGFFNREAPVRVAEEVLPEAPSLEVGVDLGSVRCVSETAIAELLLKDDDLQQRLAAASEGMNESLVQDKLNLLTGAYRVAAAITPTLHNLGLALKSTLRLVQPLDMYVQAEHERNAFCLPSRSGKRLIMCLNSGLVEAMSLHELMSVMGHEAGHAILGHGKISRIPFGHPNFSFLEVARLRALDRRQELSCDRIGLISCGDVRVSCSALFKLASGLSDRWITFDEAIYAKAFDDIADLTEIVNVAHADASHPMIPLRVAALIAFGRSELYAKAVGLSDWDLAAADLEKTIENMLAMVEPDFTELETADDASAFNRMVVQGAMLVVASDGVVAPEEVSWFRSQVKDLELDADFLERIVTEEFQKQTLTGLEPVAHILCAKLSTQKRAGLLRVLCDVAVCAGGILEGEFRVLDHLRQLLEIPPDFASSVLDAAKRNATDDTSDDNPQQDVISPPVDQPAKPPKRDVTDDKAERTKIGDPLEVVIRDERVRERSRLVLKDRCDDLRRRSVPATIALKELAAWVITASGPKGPLTQAQARVIVLSAIEAARQMKEQLGLTPRTQANPLSLQIRQFGLATLFRKGQKVVRVSDDRIVTVASVSRTRNVVGVSEEGAEGQVAEVEPHELRKNPTSDDWPVEFTFA